MFIIGMFFVKFGENNLIMGVFYKGFIVMVVLFVVVFVIIIFRWFGVGMEYIIFSGVLFIGFDLFICGIIGFIVMGLIIWVIEYYIGIDYWLVKLIV